MPVDDGDALPAVVDHIVVGAGTAGCVVATRLSKDPGRTVLLLEAGSVIDPAVAAVPGHAPMLQSGTTVDRFLTVPQRGLDGRSVAVLAGHGVGGGSAVNMLGWFQGHPDDYDGWRDAGAEGWSWSSMRPVFREIEDHELGATHRHGAGGPIAVSTPLHVEPTTTAFLEACARQGVVVGPDLEALSEDRRNDAAGLVPGNIRDGRRCSVLDGYLDPARHRDNLAVRCDSPVASLLVEAGRVVGVRVGEHEVRARRGVVLTAGAVRTPQLLMLAGIGPVDHLHELGIPLLVEAPGVGSGLREHPMVPTLWPVRDDAPATSPDLGDPERVYRLARRGPLSSSGQGLALIRSAPALDAPDLQLIVTPPLAAPVVAALTGADPSDVTRPAVVGFVALLTPRSSGTVRLAGTDSRDTPVVDPDYLGHHDDLARVRAGLRRLHEVLTTEPAASYLSPPEWLRAGSDDALDAYARAAAGPYHHPVGSARMGTDAAAVVTPDLRVRGVDGLHVADASVFPTPVRANTHAATVAVAEHAARLVAADG